MTSFELIIALLIGHSKMGDKHYREIPDGFELISVHAKIKANLTFKDYQ